MDPVAFTSRNEHLTSELMTPCGVGASKDSTTPFSPADIQQYSALWDTGATASVISTEVVNRLGLSPISQCRTYHAQGESIVNVYLVDLLLPNHLLIRDIRVTEGHLNGFGVLIGMDIINLGDFALTHREGKTVFSFQIPATHEYDFVKQIQQGVGQKKKGKKKK